MAKMYHYVMSKKTGKLKSRHRSRKAAISEIKKLGPKKFMLYSTTVRIKV